MLDEMKEKYDELKGANSTNSKTNKELEEFLGKEMANMYLNMTAMLMMSMMLDKDGIETFKSGQIEKIKNRNIKILKLRDDGTPDEDCKNGIEKFINSSIMVLGLSLMKSQGTNGNELVKSGAPMFKSMCDGYRITIPKKEKVKKVK
jgi:hypothetical protein